MTECPTCGKRLEDNGGCSLGHDPEHEEPNVDGYTRADCEEEIEQIGLAMEDIRSAQTRLQKLLGDNDYSDSLGDVYTQLYDHRSDRQTKLLDLPVKEQP